MLLEDMVGKSPGISPIVEDLASISEVPGSMPAPPREATKKAETNGHTSVSGNILPPKADKPRPHVCTTCGRSFARLEHLKRHERSHTKEKPFECPDCSRCFARRDLLLRHQQKLHMAPTPSSRPRNARRESTGAAPSSTNRVRKNSVATSSSNTMRPRANTISHVDGAGMGSVNSVGALPAEPGPPSRGHAYRPSLGSSLDFHRSFVPGPYLLHGLPKLGVSGFPLDFPGPPHVAPTYDNFDMGLLGTFGGQGNTINPAQLHFGGSPHDIGNDCPSPPFPHGVRTVSHTVDLAMDDESSLDWINGLGPSLPFGASNESAIYGSSPSAMSTGSADGFNETTMDNRNNLSAPLAEWHNPFLRHTATSSIPFPADYSSSLNELEGPLETVSPKSLMSQTPFTETYSTPPSMTLLGQPTLGPHSHSMFPSSMATSGEYPNPFNPSLANSAMRSQHLSESTDTFTDSTRQALLTSMGQPSGFSHRKYSQPAIEMTSSREIFAGSAASDGTGQLPSTLDMQRYISAYITYFHPHMPFLHIPTLNFQAPEYTNNLRTPNGQINLNSTGISGGGGCLILSMAAIGALYEFETAASRDLFEAAKKMIQLYLEERRKVDVSVALCHSSHTRDEATQNTPLWLVQAMLLNVTYGHGCGDKTCANIASTHCAALVSLARAANLTRNLDPGNTPRDYLGPDLSEPDILAVDSNSEPWTRTSFSLSKERKEWLDWKIVEERKRTLYAIFALSSLLVSAYNHAPTLTNSEIQLDLPCEEDLWAAKSPQAWKKIGGHLASKRGLSFSSALATLLTAGQREQQQGQMANQQFVQENLPNSDIKPSTFGCLILIYALHNYIWETRQRHVDRQWTSRETDAMQVHIEPALRAWQAAWTSNPVHSLERPNPFGAGPLSADSIPLLDIAYIKLFVDLGGLKEAFWQRDWDVMPDSMVLGTEIVLREDDITSDATNPSMSDALSQLDRRRDSVTDLRVRDLTISSVPTQGQPVYQPVQSKRERLLRKAAYYAADSISMSDQFANTFSEFACRELPFQCAMCSSDCAQVLAEWVTTLQERVGPHLGVLGRDDANVTYVSEMMLLEDEDRKLLEKIKEILASMESKMQQEAQSSSSMSAMSVLQRLPSAVAGGYGCKILVATANLLDGAGVWPVTKVIARTLDAQALQLKERTEKSVAQASIST